MEENKKHIPHIEISTYNPELPKRQPPQNTYTYSPGSSNRTHGGSYIRNRDRNNGNGGSNDGNNQANK